VADGVQGPEEGDHAREDHFNHAQLAVEEAQHDGDEGEEGTYLGGLEGGIHPRRSGGVSLQEVPRLLQHSGAVVVQDPPEEHERLEGGDGV